MGLFDNVRYFKPLLSKPELAGGPSKLIIVNDRPKESTTSVLSEFASLSSMTKEHSLCNDFAHEKHKRSVSHSRRSASGSAVARQKTLTPASSHASRRVEKSFKTIRFTIGSLCLFLVWLLVYAVVAFRLDLVLAASSPIFQREGSLIATVFVLANIFYLLLVVGVMFLVKLVAKKWLYILAFFHLVSTAPSCYGFAQYYKNIKLSLTDCEQADSCLRFMFPIISYFLGYFLCFFGLIYLTSRKRRVIRRQILIC